MTDGDAGENTGDASTDATATSLGPVAVASAVIVETEPEEIAWNSSTGASTTGGCVALTSGIGVVSLCENTVSEGREMVSIDELPDVKDCEAPTCLVLTM